MTTRHLAAILLMALLLASTSAEEGVYNIYDEFRTAEEEDIPYSTFDEKLLYVLWMDGNHCTQNCSDQIDEIGLAVQEVPFYAVIVVGGVDFYAFQLMTWDDEKVKESDYIGHDTSDGFMYQYGHDLWAESNGWEPLNFLVDHDGNFIQKQAGILPADGIIELAEGYFAEYPQYHPDYSPPETTEVDSNITTTIVEDPGDDPDPHPEPEPPTPTTSTAESSVIAPPEDGPQPQSVIPVVLLTGVPFVLLGILRKSGGGGSSSAQKKSASDVLKETQEKYYRKFKE